MEKKINDILNKVKDKKVIDDIYDLMNDIDALQSRNILLENFVSWYIVEKFDRNELYNNKPMLLHFFNYHILNNFKSAIHINKKEHFDKFKTNLFEYLVANKLYDDFDIDSFIREIRLKIDLILKDTIDEL